MNLVVLRGVLSSAPVVRELASGSLLVSCEVTTRDTTGQASSVPVAWFDPPGGAVTLEAGEEVVVAGAVRRRFFRSGGATQTRTEVVASSMVPARRRRDVSRLLDRVSGELAG